MRTLKPLSLWIVGLALVGCGASLPDEPLGGAGGKADSLADAAEFFDGKIYYVRINNWPGDRMTPDAIGHGEHSYKNAEILIYRIDANNPSHCPDQDVGEQDLVHRVVGDFSVQLSGNKTFGTPKSSYKIKFETDEARFVGMKTLNLKSMWNDVSQMREALAWRIFGRIGVPAPRHTYARFCINDRYYGLFSAIEQVDKAFLKERFGASSKGNLYKGDWPAGDLGAANLVYRGLSGKDYVKVANVASDDAKQRLGAMDERTYQLKTNEEADDDPEQQSYDDLATLIRTIAGKDAEGQDLPGGEGRFDTDAYRQAVEAILDVKGALRWAAANNLLGAWDNYWRTPSNYYLYNAGPAGSPKKFMKQPFFHVIPWDYDHSFGLDWIGVKWQEANLVSWAAPLRGQSGSFQPPKIPLVQNLLKNSGFRKYYLEKVKDLLDDEFSTSWVESQIGERGEGGLLDRVRVSAMLESEVEHRPARDCSDPVYCLNQEWVVKGDWAPHTGRKYSWDQVYWNGLQHHELSFQGAFILGIWHHVSWRAGNARSQLKGLGVN